MFGMTKARVTYSWAGVGPKVMNAKVNKDKINHLLTLILYFITFFDCSTESNYLSHCMGLEHLFTNLSHTMNHIFIWSPNTICNTQSHRNLVEDKKSQTISMILI